MAKNLHSTSPSDLLPVRQRLAWMAAIWTLSVGAIVLASLAVHALIA